MAEACNLADKSCTACQGGVEPLKGDTLKPYTDQLGEGWQVIDEHHLEKVFKFKNFKEALAFVNRVGEVAEAEGHHPNIEFTWGRAKIITYTHKIDGLHENDFILAAKVDQVA